MTEDEPKLCIYPGCERPAVPPHPLGGPQPAFCDLEEHNALTAHQERQRLARITALSRCSASTLTKSNISGMDLSAFSSDLESPAPTK